MKASKLQFTTRSSFFVVIEKYCKYYTLLSHYKKEYWLKQKILQHYNLQLPIQEQLKSASEVLISFLHILVASCQVTGYDTDQKIGFFKGILSC